MDTKVREAIDNAKASVLAHLARTDVPIGRTAGHLMAVCGFTKGDKFWAGGAGFPHSRLLDRALQELRKEGKIRFERPEWKIVT